MSEETQLKTPEHLIRLLKSLPISGKSRLALNRRLANMTSKYFRAQLSAQRDIDNKPFEKRRVTKTYKGKDISRARMFLGISRSLRAMPTDEGFSVGVAGLMGHIGKVHNEGQSVKFSYRMHSFFNPVTNRFEGGEKQDRYFTMPKRPFIGFSDDLVRLLEAEIMKEMELRS